MDKLKRFLWTPILIPIYFFVGNAILTFLIIFLLFFVNFKKQENINISNYPQYSQSQNILANNQSSDIQPNAKSIIEIEDARIQLVANFIKNNDVGKNSPLQPYDYFAKIFVTEADKNGLDFRLLPAIARKESTFCKSNIGKKYFNCFGWDVPDEVGDNGKFASYEEGIEIVALGLKNNYLDKGLTNVIDIMNKYCPPSAEGEGDWAKNINQWLAEMRFDDKILAKKNTQNTDLTEFVQ